MAQFFEIHPDNPQRRLIQQAVSIIDRGGLVIYPTDSSYALGCHIGDKNAMERIQRLRRTDNKHHFTLVCSDLSEIGTYAKVDNADYRLMKSLTPGPYTFLLRATSVVPRRLMNPKRKTIGVRVPDNRIVHALLSELGQPIMSSTLIPPGATDALDDAVEGSREPAARPAAARERAAADAGVSSSSSAMTGKSTPLCGLRSARCRQINSWDRERATAASLVRASWATSASV